MNEYKVKLAHGFFSSITEYVKADSAGEVKKALEDKLSYEMEFEGLRIVEISRV